MALPRRPEKKSKSRKQQKLLLGLIPLGLAVPLLTCCCLSPFELYSARVGVGLGLVLFIAAIIMTVLQMRKKGASTGEDVPWYLRGGGAMMFFQIHASIKYPLEIGTWVALEIIAGAVLMGSGIMIERRNPPRLFGAFGDGNPPVAQGNPQRPVEQPPFKNQPKEEKPQAQGVTGDAALDRLLAEVESKNPFVANKAADALAAMQPNQHRAAVARKLAEEMQRAGNFGHEPFIKALGTWGTAAEVPALIKVLDGDALFGREAVINALGRLKDERAIPPLARRLRGLGSRDHAANALRQFGAAAENQVLPLLNDNDPFLQIAVAKLLKDIGTQQSVPALQKLASTNAVTAAPVANDAIAAINARSKK